MAVSKKYRIEWLRAKRSLLFAAEAYARACAEDIAADTEESLRAMALAEDVLVGAAIVFAKERKYP